MKKSDILESAKGPDVLPTTVDSMQLRRSDHEDAKEIEVFLGKSKYALYRRVYASADIMHFIETSFLSISVLTPDGKLVAFAAFDHSPIVWLHLHKLFVGSERSVR